MRKPATGHIVAQLRWWTARTVIAPKVARKCYTASVLIDPRTFRRVVEIRGRLLADDDRTIAELAAAAGLSASRLIRVFSSLFGTTPHQLRTQVRLERARQRLAVGVAVTDVCMEVGFSSVGSFSALFTRWTGTPPSRYRRLVQVPARIAPLVPGCLGMLARLPRNFREARPAAAR